MTAKKKILVIGRHSDMMMKITGILREKGYDATGSLNNEEAIALFRTTKADAVIIGGGVDTESRHLFHSLFLEMHPDVKIIDAHPHTLLPDLKNAFPEKE